MEGGELTPYELHGMQPVLFVPDVDATVTYYRDVLGFCADFIAGDPPAQPQKGRREVVGQAHRVVVGNVADDRDLPALEFLYGEARHSIALLGVGEAHPERPLAIPGDVGIGRRRRDGAVHDRSNHRHCGG